LSFNKINLNVPNLEPFFKFETGHSQTLMSHFIRSPDFIQDYEVQYVTFADGDQCGLKIYENKGSNKKNIVLSLYHGLAGDHRSDYIQRTARVAFDRGWTVVMVDHRGAGLAQGRARLPYHSGRGEDISDVISYLRQRFSNSLQVANGFSMSGSILLNLITGRRGQMKPDYAVIVNAPVDLRSAADLLNKGLSRIYDLRFYHTLRQELVSHFDVKLPLIGGLRCIEDRFTAVRSGFKNRDDYYEHCSTEKYIANIKTPTFLLTAEDDPFISFEKYKNLSWPDSVHTTYSKYGGHVGYFSKKDIMSGEKNFKKRWMDQYLDRAFQKIEENISYHKN
jgi:uncharacterized protein